MMSLAWGGWDVRVYATEAWLSLAPRFSAEQPHIGDMIERMVGDPVPQVRLQVASNLQMLRQSDPERMWRIAEQFAAHEPHSGVLTAFVGRSLRRLLAHDMSRSERLLEVIRARLPLAPSDPQRTRDDLQWTVGTLAAALYVWDGRPLAGQWIRGWAEDAVRFADSLDGVLSSLRFAFFARYRPEASEQDRQASERAQRCLQLILGRVLELARTARAALAAGQLQGDEKDQTIGRYREGERLLHHGGNQLYFGSGAHRDGDSAPGLSTIADQQAFLADYQAVLGLLARSHEPGTHHHLLELYEYLIPGDPPAVFEAMHGLLTGQAADEGYQHESLGLMVVVRVVRRYLADHRALFDDPSQRRRLSEILRLFSDQGWPDALQLLYELPDLLR